jgi:DNA-binding transcriptional LysR family regulator
MRRKQRVGMASQSSCDLERTIGANPVLRFKNVRGVSGESMLGGEPGTGTGRLLESYFGNTGRSPRLSMQLGSTEAVKEAVKAGLGVSLVLQSAVTEEVRNGSLCAIPLQRPKLEKDLFVIWRDSGLNHFSRPPFVRHLIGDASAESERRSGPVQ